MAQLDAVQSSPLFILASCTSCSKRTLFGLFYSASLCVITTCMVYDENYLSSFTRFPIYTWHTWHLQYILLSKLVCLLVWSAEWLDRCRQDSCCRSRDTFVRFAYPLTFWDAISCGCSRRHVSKWRRRRRRQQRQEFIDLLVPLLIIWSSDI